MDGPNIGSPDRGPDDPGARPPAGSGQRPELDPKRQYGLTDVLKLTTGLAVVFAATLTLPTLGMLVAEIALIYGFVQSVRSGWRSLRSSASAHDLDRAITVSLAVGILAAAGCSMGIERNTATGKSRCEPVIRALDAYHGAHSRYPQRLQELVPRYLPSVPSGFEPDALRTGTSYFRYPADKGRPEGYSLVFFPLPGTPLRCSYSPKTRSWETWD